jgi:nucleotide-binding universal stress UspA family protein
MQKILLAVDGSPSAIRATQSLIELCGTFNEPPEIHVLTVHRPVPNVGSIAPIITTEMREHYYREECDAALSPITSLLDAAKRAYTEHRIIGSPAESIVDESKRLGCTVIFMGTRGHTALTNMVLGSVTTKVLHLSKVPVTLVH